MNPGAKNKILVWLVILLLVANAATIAVFWLSKAKHPAGPQRSPKDFLITELKLDTKQQEQLQILVREHRRAAEELRTKTREAKEFFFDLLKQTNVSESSKQAAAKAVSVNTEALDLLTLDHFQKVRELCRPDQQEKFDAIIHDLTRMMGQPRPPPGDRNGPPPGEGRDDRPPPPIE